MGPIWVISSSRGTQTFFFGSSRNGVAQGPLNQLGSHQDHAGIKQGSRWDHTGIVQEKYEDHACKIIKSRATSVGIAHPRHPCIHGFYQCRDRVEACRKSRKEKKGKQQREGGRERENERGEGRQGWRTTRILLEDRTQALCTVGRYQRPTSVCSLPLASRLLPVVGFLFSVDFLLVFCSLISVLWFLLIPISISSFPCKLSILNIQGR